MAYYATYYTDAIPRMNSFAEVAARYEQVKPVRLRSQAYKDRLMGDIRPIGMRRRQWERVIKLTRNRYVLSAGWNKYHYRGGGAHSYIEWIRGKGGEERITILPPPKYSISYPRFLRNVLPSCVSVHTEDGLGNKYLWVDRTKYYFRDENSPLTIVRRKSGDRWEYHSGHYWKCPPPRHNVIDHDVRAPYKDRVFEFTKYVHIMTPLLLDDLNNAPAGGEITNFIPVDPRDFRSVLLAGPKSPYWLLYAKHVMRRSLRWEWSNRKYYMDNSVYSDRVRRCIHELARFYTKASPVGGGS